MRISGSRPEPCRTATTRRSMPFCVMFAPANRFLKDALEELEDKVGRLPFVGSARIGDGSEKIAAEIRSTLGVAPDQHKRCKGAGALFSLLRTATERAGVYVLLLGDVGSHHSDIGEDVFRGFALADETVPFVVINDNDAVSARPFTLLHELAHIWLGASGVSGPLRNFPENVVERFCNDTASEFLLPPDGIPDFSILRTADLEKVNQAIRQVAGVWNVSEPAVAYRFAKKAWIDQPVAAMLFTMFSERWRREKQREKESRQPDDTAPSFYTIHRHRLGAALLGTVRRALQEETLTHTRAAKILGVGPASVAPLLQEERASGR